MAGRDEDAPWLAEAPPLARPAGGARRRPMLNIAIAVLAFGAIAAVALLMLLGRKDGGSSQGYMEASQAPLIEADAGPFKVAPENREGLEVEGDGGVIYDAVRGEGVQSQIDLNAVPEELVGRPRDLMPPAGTVGGQAPAPTGQSVPVQVLPAPNAGQGVAQKPAPTAVQATLQKPAPVPVPAAKPVAPAVQPVAKPLANIAQALQKSPAVTPTASAAGNALVQIGAFSSEEKAQEEWTRVAGKGKLTGKRIEKISNSSGKILWRVRGQTSNVAEACKAILAAKGACEVVKS